VRVKRHVAVCLDEDGDPVRAYDEITDARAAVDSDTYQNEDIVDYVPDVPVLAGDSDE
jgi:hypothetical protein